MKFTQALEQHSNTKLEKPRVLEVDELGGVKVVRHRDMSMGQRTRINQKATKLRRGEANVQMDVLMAITIREMLRHEDGTYLFGNDESAVSKLRDAPFPLVEKLYKFATGDDESPLEDSETKSEEASSSSQES